MNKNNNNEINNNQNNNQDNYDDNDDDNYDDNNDNDNDNDDNDGNDDNNDDNDDDNYDGNDDNDDGDNDNDNDDDNYEFNRQDILDSIAIARETYIFSYMNENQDINERIILKFIYEQIANIYNDVSLIKLLLYIKHYYTLNFSEYKDIFDLFFISVYPQAITTDRLTSGLIQITSTRNEIPNSFISSSQINNMNQIINNIINPINYQNNDISSNINGVNQERNNYGNSLLSEISFLATIFNIQTNESLTHILNLINNIGNIESEKDIADTFKVKELITNNFNELKKETLDKNSDFCTICQETYDTDNTVKLLPCGHFFHCTCIEPWLLNCSNLCPICRNKI